MCLQLYTRGPSKLLKREKTKAITKTKETIEKHKPYPKCKYSSCAGFTVTFLQSDVTAYPGRCYFIVQVLQKQMKIYTPYGNVIEQKDIIRKQTISWKVQQIWRLNPGCYYLTFFSCTCEWMEVWVSYRMRSTFPLLLRGYSPLKR